MMANLLTAGVAVLLWHAVDALRAWWRGRRVSAALPDYPAPTEPAEPSVHELLAREMLRVLRQQHRGLE
jgi:threonine/homoserine/homoserine lactone efflux protein